jgi:hypothetical protein
MDRIPTVNPRIILSLALVLSGGLFGCSTMPRGVMSDSSEGKLFSNQEAICLKSDDSSRPWQLKYALTEPTVNEGSLFVTVHGRGDVESSADLSKWQPEYTAAIYVRIGDKFKLLKRLKAPQNLSCFLKPNFIWATPKGEGREQLIQITELFYGTGAITQEHVFTTSSGKEFAPDLTLDEVEFIPAWESFQDHFGKNEGIWKGESSRFTNDGLAFEFLVWSGLAGDLHPVGKVTGTYKLERKSDGGLRISMDTFQREPVKDEDWH